MCHHLIGIVSPEKTYRVFCTYLILSALYNRELGGRHICDAPQRVSISVGFYDKCVGKPNRFYSIFFNFFTPGKQTHGFIAVVHIMHKSVNVAITQWRGVMKKLVSIIFIALLLNPTLASCYSFETLWTNGWLGGVLPGTFAASVESHDSYSYYSGDSGWWPSGESIWGSTSGEAGFRVISDHGNSTAPALLNFNLKGNAVNAISGFNLNLDILNITDSSDFISYHKQFTFTDSMASSVSLPVNLNTGDVYVFIISMFSGGGYPAILPQGPEDHIFIDTYATLTGSLDLPSEPYPTPEPSSLLLLSAGVIGLAAFLRKRNHLGFTATPPTVS